MLSSSQFYGAGQFLGKPSKLLPSCSWTHGVIFSLLSPYVIISREDAVFDYHLVTDEEQADLAGKVFSNVVAVGLPFAHAYTRDYDPGLVRGIKRLFLSAHSLARENSSPLSTLLESAKSMDCDALILPGSEFEQIFGSTKDDVMAGEIRIFKGASTKDFDSYVRIISIFSRTKTLVTDCAGSHAYYATACGCEFDLSFAEITDEVVRDKINANCFGLVEPWRSALENHFRNHKSIEREILEFSENNFNSMHEIALKKIGLKFIPNLEKIKEKIHQTSSIKLISKNINLFSRKMEAKFIIR
jgi:hypothetical protein